MKKIFIIIFLGLVAAAATVWYRGGFGTAENLPTPLPHQNSNHNGGSTILPSEVNLDVPFTTQAPKVVWDADHEEFCEEASALMAAAYAKDFAIPNADFADQKLYEIKNFELDEFGYFKDTTAAETAVILKKHFGLSDVTVQTNPTLEQIKKALVSGKVVLVPAAGRMLGNPNFTGAGPLYHMLLIKGYTKDGKIITNDPGTRKGANYLYSAEVLMNAMHDWNGGDVEHGQKVIIIVG